MGVLNDFIRYMNGIFGNIMPILSIPVMMFLVSLGYKLLRNLMDCTYEFSDNDEEENIDEYGEIREEMPIDIKSQYKEIK